MFSWQWIQIRLIDVTKVRRSNIVLYWHCHCEWGKTWNEAFIHNLELPKNSFLPTGGYYCTVWKYWLVTAVCYTDIKCHVYDRIRWWTMFNRLIHPYWKYKDENWWTNHVAWPLREVSRHTRRWLTGPGVDQPDWPLVRIYSPMEIVASASQLPSLNSHTHAP